jgi:hypothetical protein
VVDEQPTGNYLKLIVLLATLKHKVLLSIHFRITSRLLTTNLYNFSLLTVTV